MAKHCPLVAANTGAVEPVGKSLKVGSKWDLPFEISPGTAALSRARPTNRAKCLIIYTGHLVRNIVITWCKFALLCNAYLENLN